MKPNIQFTYVKHLLNLAYVVSVIKVIRDQQKPVDANQRARGADEITAYRDRVWFESHARHTWCESTTGKLLLSRREGQVSAAPKSRRKDSANLRRRLREQRDTVQFFGTKFGRISSLPPAVKVIA